VSDETDDEFEEFRRQANLNEELEKLLRQDSKLERKRPSRYILDAAGRPVHEPDLLKWARWFEEHREERVVARTRVGECQVSTIFLALDHRWDEDGPPILWETLVFRRGDEADCDRCSGSREQAEAMHAAMVAELDKRLNH
jgi:hypothetical protein